MPKQPIYFSWEQNPGKSVEIQKVQSQEMVFCAAADLSCVFMEDISGRTCSETY